MDTLMATLNEDVTPLLLAEGIEIGDIRKGTMFSIEKKEGDNILCRPASGTAFILPINKVTITTLLENPGEEILAVVGRRY